MDLFLLREYLRQSNTDLEPKLRRLLVTDESGRTLLTDRWTLSCSIITQIIDIDVMETQIIDYDALEMRKFEDQESYTRLVEFEEG